MFSFQGGRRRPEVAGEKIPPDDSGSPGQDIRLDGAPGKKGVLFEGGQAVGDGIPKVEGHEGPPPKAQETNAYLLPTL